MFKQTLTLFIASLTLLLIATAKDHRDQGPKTLDGYFPFTPPSSANEWQQRREQVRKQILVSLGLWPMPEKTPLNPIVYGAVDCGDYTVERVIFESLPGFFVTGNLYRPKAGVGSVGPDGKRAVVLQPHGHSRHGRLGDMGVRGERALQSLVDSGSSGFLDAGRNAGQTMCVQMARMGCIAFAWDMLGKADSFQIPPEVCHQYEGDYHVQRAEMNDPESWGLFSPQAEGWDQNLMGLQTWNSIRVLDFIETLPDADPTRIGVTGPSGGGTQTFMLCALDSRPIVAGPAVMVSTAMQGGCICENANGLRVGMGNVDFASLHAPRPMIMTSANDWTKEMDKKGFPEMQELWKMLGKPDDVQLAAFLQFGHSYNGPSRHAIQVFFNEHLKLNQKESEIEEKPFQFLTRENLTVWTDEHPAPTGEQVGPEFEKRLLQYWKNDAQKQLAEKPELAREGWKVILRRSLEDAGNQFSFEEIREFKTSDGEFTIKQAQINNLSHQEEVKVSIVQPKQANGNLVLWLDGSFEPNAELLERVKKGDTVVMSALYAPEQTKNKMSKVNSETVAGYTYGYNGN